MSLEKHTQATLAALVKADVVVAARRSTCSPPLIAVAVDPATAMLAWMLGRLDDNCLIGVRMCLGQAIGKKPVPVCSECVKALLLVADWKQTPDALEALVLLMDPPEW